MAESKKTEDAPKSAPKAAEPDAFDAQGAVKRSYRPANEDEKPSPDAPAVVEETEHI